MKIFCNGEGFELAADATLAEALSSYLEVRDAPAPKGLAVACNGDVVPRPLWSQRQLAEGDRLDLFSAVAGG
ncbi:sulfur carrier protein ThiS [Saccharospirillum alexandrii]|uniref:sulfur carrier protein ThiS n=1 Tax=Saccharospirillum alexandrii TaxID=2448477 RepID=UPI0037351A72